METLLNTQSFAPTSTSKRCVDKDLAESAVEVLLEYIGEDPHRDGLKGTPRRVLKALEEMTAGYKEDPEEILATTFDVDIANTQMVVLDTIQFTSLCEHHLLPFSGTASVGYIPNPIIEKPIVGLSKLARLVTCFAHRLQVQERMTEQIADALESSLDPLGCGVVVRAVHSCMSCRGVKQPESVMITSQMRGSFLNDINTRQEFLSCLRDHK